jgi:hypothetical protein
MLDFSVDSIVFARNFLKKLFGQVECWQENSFDTVPTTVTVRFRHRLQVLLALWKTDRSDEKCWREDQATV